MNKLLFLLSESVDPYENLALENHFLGTVKEDEKVLIVYRNRPSIVLGRFQNPWVECDIKNILKENVNLVRRQSGGGTVYHDLRNINFCFINSGNKHEKDDNNIILVKALKSLGIEAYASGRSDILVDRDGPKKVSGSAFKQKRDSSFHHGTMLINSDLTRLNNYLNTAHGEIKGKGIKSVRSKVLNLTEINSDLSEENYIEALKREFSLFYGKEVDIVDFSRELIDSSYVESLKNWNWKFGETPEFELKKEFDGISFYLKAKKGIIKDFDLTSDYIDIHLGLYIKSALLEAKIDREFIEKKFDLIGHESTGDERVVERVCRAFLGLLGF